MAMVRARRVDPTLRDQLGREAGQGGLTRTGSKAIDLMHRARRWHVKRLHDNTGLDAVETRAWQYHEEGSEAFAPGSCNVVSCALDASRVGGRDTLFVALYAPELKKALWCPPQAPQKRRKNNAPIGTFNP